MEALRLPQPGQQPADISREGGILPLVLFNIKKFFRFEKFGEAIARLPPWLRA